MRPDITPLASRLEHGQNFGAIVNTLTSGDLCINAAEHSPGMIGANARSRATCRLHKLRRPPASPTKRISRACIDAISASRPARDGVNATPVQRA
jgi:hypothetical protein